MRYQYGVMVLFHLPLYRHCKGQKGAPNSVECALKHGIFIIYWAGIEPSPLLLTSLTGLLYLPWMLDGDDYGTVGGVSGYQGLPYLLENICSITASSTTNST
jgi:hypothetical protein